MRAAWWYGVAVATLVWVAEVFTLETVPESSALDQQIAGPLALATLVAWLVMPLCIYLDQRAFRDDLAWAPTTWLWVLASLVWLLNIVVGTAYCLRRYVATRQSPPTNLWRSVVAGAVGAWALLIVLDVLLPPGTVSGPAFEALTALLALSWVAMPIAVLMDAVRARGFTDWDPNSRAYLIGTAIPIVNLVVGAVYLYKRREAFDDADPDRQFSLPDADSTADAGSPGSPWFPRAGYVFGAYILLLVVVGAALPSLSDAGLELLAITAWVPFGPFFAGCVYKDAAWRRANDHPVGTAWWLYLASTLIQGAAFWYLVRRATKAARIR